MNSNVRIPPLPEAPKTVVGGTPTSVFPFDFPFFAPADIVVLVDDVELSQSAFTVTGYALQDGQPVIGGYGSGQVTLDVPVANCTVTIDRDVATDRETQFSRSAPLGMPALNGDLNRLTARQQDYERHSVRRPLGDVAGQFLAFDAMGRPVGMPASFSVDVTPASVPSLALAIVTSFPTSLSFVRTEGFQSPGDQGGAIYRRVAVAPSHAGKFQSADGAWWEIAQAVLTPQMFGAIADDWTKNCKPAIDAAFACGVALKRTVRPPRGLYRVDADPVNAWCILYPAGLTLDVRDGPVFKAQDGLTSWKRVICFQGISGVRVIGRLKVDGNVDNIGANNEHMHGVFIYDLTDSQFDGFDVANTRGDGIFVGGTDDTQGTQRVKLGDIDARRVGRKALVFQHCYEVDVNVVTLDQREGGAQLYGGVPDGTDGNCIDVEPDVYSGTVPNGFRIQKLVTYGAGNDFTAGTTGQQGEAWVAQIDDFEMHVTPRAGVAWWIQNAITIRGKRLHVTGITDVCEAAQFFYAARLQFDEVRINGQLAGDYLGLVAMVGGHRPVFQLGSLIIGNSTGNGLENRDGSIRVDGRVTAKTAGVAIWNRGLSSTAGQLAEIDFGSIRLDDVGAPLGAGYAMLNTMAGSIVPQFRIGTIIVSDSRSPRLNYAIYNGPGVCEGLELGEYVDRSGVQLVGFDGPDRYFKTGVREYFCIGTPEGMIPSGKGGRARRLDGGAGTTAYDKEAAVDITDKTGWAAK